ENANIMEEKEEQEKDIKEHKPGEQEKETGVNENKEREVEEEEKKSNSDPHRNENDSCNKEGQPEVKHKEEDKRTDEREIKEKKRLKMISRTNQKFWEEKVEQLQPLLLEPPPSHLLDPRPEEMPWLSFRRTSKHKIIQWCRNKTQKYEVKNFSSSWSDGLAFCALVHHFFPSAFDFFSLKASEREKNFTLAFSTAEYSTVNIKQINYLSISDLLLTILCVFTYVHMEKDKIKEDDPGVSGGNEDGEEDEIKQNEETEKKGSKFGSERKTEQEIDHNENVINADVVDEK
uniref:Calponin-homology (CH) domain-containing protein n=1 Tax=Cyprinus carpio carpio TaxID=630221 RepID=A0A8C1ADU7_CYPCA